MNKEQYEYAMARIHELRSRIGPDPTVCPHHDVYLAASRYVRGNTPGHGYITQEPVMRCRRCGMSDFEVPLTWEFTPGGGVSMTWKQRRHRVTTSPYSATLTNIELCEHVKVIMQQSFFLDHPFFVCKNCGGVDDDFPATWETVYRMTAWRFEELA